MKKYFIYIPVLLVVISIPITLIVLNKDKAKETEIVQQEDDRSMDAQGTIYVEGGEGTLVEGGYMSYIGESARGLEAYLATKGASAIYEVNSTQTSYYTLWVKVSDDGLYPNNTRDATVVINNSQTLVYQHISEDTKGWKWYEVGITPLNEGNNTFTFTKNETTSGAYVMDEFKLIPN